MSDTGAPRRPGFGLLLLAVGRSEGFRHFGTDNEAFLASLAPLTAFALVSAGLVALSGRFLLAAKLCLISLIGLLAPPVIAHPLCRRWGRRPGWALYANILNWAKLLFLVVAPFTAGLIASVPVLGVPAVACMLGYSFWLQWFIARGALDLSRWRALVLVLLTQTGTNLLIILPLLAGGSRRLEVLGN